MGKVYIGNKEVSPLLVQGGTTDGLTKAQADKLYVGKTDASNTYLKKTDANNTYLKKTDADNTYLKKSETDNKLLPSQAGNSGKFLSTNGSTAAWVDAPSGGASGFTKEEADWFYIAKDESGAAMFDMISRTQGQITVPDKPGTLALLSDLEGISGGSGGLTQEQADLLYAISERMLAKR